MDRDLAERFVVAMERQAVAYEGWLELQKQSVALNERIATAAERQAGTNAITNMNDMIAHVQEALQSLMAAWGHPDVK